MKNSTKIMLCCGGALYCVTFGGATLLLASLAAAGVYQGNQSLAEGELTKTIDNLQRALDKLPEGERKRQLERAKAQYLRDIGTLKIASCCLAAGTFISPLIGVGWFVGSCLVRYRARAREVKVQSAGLA